MQANHLMPSYIQILFAPRKPIPYLQPIKKPFKYQFVPFNDGQTDYGRLKEILAQKKKEREANQHFQEEVRRKQEVYQRKKGVSWKDKEKRWKDKMQKHVQTKQTEFVKWKEGLNNPDFENVTSDPYKTLIVYNLVLYLFYFY
jgi:hypothetical protein